jgi:hypothetical protein
MFSPPHPPWFNHPNNIRRRISSSLCSFLHDPSSYLLGPNILLNTLFSNTLSLCSSPKVRDQVSHPYSTTGKITVLNILIFNFFGCSCISRYAIVTSFHFVAYLLFTPILYFLIRRYVTFAVGRASLNKAIHMYNIYMNYICIGKTPVQLSFKY